MIPKIIHYVWLGKKEKPDLVKRCIASWRKFLPDYEIIEWNEDNWDITKNQFALENYQAGKYAYTSDVIRLDVLYHQGGIYLDSDVEVFRSFDSLLAKKAFWGMMYDDSLGTAVIGAEKGNAFLGYLLKLYSGYTRTMLIEGRLSNTNNGIISYAMLDYYPEFSFVNSKREQLLSDGTFVFPKEYFEFPTYNKKINYSEHLFTKTWGTKSQKKVVKMVKILLGILLGKVFYGKIRSSRGAKRYVSHLKYEHERDQMRKGESTK
ncbi:glycosyltransferase family 32 protein [Liquorilactobacillus uvarum]|uniref:glycosyltransferase family 32 protein n=1 Tax=Liquorilactobacillus uvarum TaxID=303240 RepID=UPI00288AE812|nr:glycosyltransferase [Liquorilactobacillus uvarum]